jgi:hypothetical protein
MPRARKNLPAYPGVGELHYRGFTGQVDYEILGEPSGLKLGPLRLRGSFTAAPEIAEQAFREGEGVLTLEDGRRFRVTFLGHTAGAGTAYFEMRV